MSRSRAAARAVADLNRGTIHAVVEIDAPPERVYAALSTSEIASWWGSDDTYRVTEWEGELRVGGHWESRGVSADGRRFRVSGEFLEVDPPRRLAHSWRYDSDPEHVTTVRYDLERVPGGTRLTVRHEGFGDQTASCEGHAKGWERVLGWLTAHCEPRAAGDGPLG